MREKLASAAVWLLMLLYMVVYLQQSGSRLLTSLLEKLGLCG